MLDLSQTTNFSSHRHGWSFVMNSIRELHSKSGLYVCDFIEKDFAWNYNDSFKGRKWIGFVHNPPNIPNWFDYQNSPQIIFKRPRFLEYCKNCVGFFTLSEYLKKYIETLTPIQVFNVPHPTELSVKQWSPELFLHKKNIVQIGYWLRKIYSITTIKKSGYALEWLPGDYEYANKKRCQEGFVNGHNEGELNELWRKVKILKHIPNKEYDEKISSSIVLCDMYDSSANNAVIECITRNTPVIVPKLEAVVEYLGEDYPFYIDGPIDNMLDYDRIMEAHIYLKSMNKSFLSAQNFNKEFKKCLSQLTY